MYFNLQLSYTSVVAAVAVAAVVVVCHQIMSNFYPLAVLN